MHFYLFKGGIIFDFHQKLGVNVGQQLRKGFSRFIVTKVASERTAGIKRPQHSELQGKGRELLQRDQATQKHKHK